MSNSLTKNFVSFIFNTFFDTRVVSQAGFRLKFIKMFRACVELPTSSFWNKGQEKSICSSGWKRLDELFFRFTNDKILGVIVDKT